jgi:glutathione S-transferase
MLECPQKSRIFSFEEDGMKLYSLDLSNFAAKSRIAIYEKGLTVETVNPPGGMSSPEYKKINPLGKIPALQLDNGQMIAESEVINEYLEDKFPDKPLLPKDAESRAKVRSLSRFHDLYLDPPLRALLPKVFGKELDGKFIQDKIAEVNNRLDQLEGMMGGPWATGDMFTLADAALAPTLFFMVGILPRFGSKGPLEGRPRLAAWWGRIQDRPSTKKALGEQQAAMAAIMKKEPESTGSR